MLKKLSVIFIVLSLTSCACYSGLFKKSLPTILQTKESVFFETDSFALNSHTKKVLDEEVLPAIKGKKVIIEGNSDERGSVEYNKILGKKRAEAVKDYLVKNGADSSKISTVSYGESNPIDLNSNKEAWAKNRRALTISTQ